MLQVGLGLRHDRRVEQLPQRLGAEQLREQGRVERESLRAPLGEGRVPFVHERADVPEQQVLAERARGDRLHLDQADAPRREVAEHLGQRGHVEHVLQALADGLERDREAGELRGDLEQLRRPLPLLPQGRPPPRLPPGEQQRAGRALAEPGGEQRGPADLGGDDVADLLRVDQRDPGGRRLVGVGHPDDDPVVGVQRLHVHPAVALAEPGRDGQRPGRVHPVAVGGVQHDPPVTELVAEPLDDQRPVVGDVPGGGPLIGEVRHEVPGRERVEPARGQRRDGGLLRQGGQLAHLGAQGLAELGGPPRACRRARTAACPAGRARAAPAPGRA